MANNIGPCACAMCCGINNITCILYDSYRPPLEPNGVENGEGLN